MAEIAEDKPLQTTNEGEGVAEDAEEEERYPETELAKKCKEAFREGGMEAALALIPEEDRPKVSSFATMEQMEAPYKYNTNIRCTRNEPLKWGWRYILRQADETDRILDKEQQNEKRVVFNPKWNGGLHLGLYTNNRSIPMAIQAWGTKKWLDGNKPKDVTINGYEEDSLFYFRHLGMDKYGHNKYEMASFKGEWAFINGAPMYPDFHIDRIGFDSDWELSSKSGLSATLEVKFERVFADHA